MSNMHVAEFYVEFQADIQKAYQGTEQVTRVRAVKMTQGKAAAGAGNFIAKFAVELPDEAFLTLTPDIQVTVPVSHTAGVKAVSKPIALPSAVPSS